MPQSELLRFLAQVRADSALRQMMADALTADEVSLLAQERGFLVSGSDILRFHGQPGASSPRVGSSWPPSGGRWRRGQSTTSERCHEQLPDPTGRRHQ